MTTTLHSFVDQLQALEPRPAASAIKPLNAQALFAALLSNELDAQVGPDAHRQADHVIAEYFTAVLHCRKNEPEAALAQLLRSDALMPALPPATVGFVSLFKLSAWGNYHYKVGQGAHAIELLRQGLHLSADLERQGFGAFIYRRVEQIQNIANIHLKEQRVPAAHELLRSVIRFVHGGRAEGLLLEDWDFATMQHVRQMQEGTLDALCKQLAAQNTQFMDHAVYHNEYYYQFFFRELLREMDTDTYNRVILYNWLYVKASYFEQGPEAFLENVLEFLADPDVATSYNLLKANLLSQAIWHFRTRQPELPEAVAAIRHFARRHITDQAGNALKLAA